MPFLAKSSGNVAVAVATAIAVDLFDSLKNGSKDQTKKLRSTQNSYPKPPKSAVDG